MLEFVISDAVRYFIGSLFIFFACVIVEKESISKKDFFKKLFAFSVLYTISLTSFVILIPGNPIFDVGSMSALIVFCYLLSNNKYAKNWKYFLSYSIFINLIMECSHIVIHKIVVFVAQLRGISKATHDENVILFSFIVVVLYAFVLFLIYKSNFINQKIIERLSTYFLPPLILSLTIVVYIKYSLKFANIEAIYHNISDIFLYIILTLLLILFMMYLRDKEKVKNPLLHVSLHFMENMYKEDREFFKKKLKNMGLKPSLDGYKQLVYCLTIMKYNTSGKKINLKNNVYFYVAKYEKIEVGTLNTNCTNAILDFWDGIKDENYKLKLTNKIAGPSLGEFLHYVIEDTKNDQNKSLVEVKETAAILI